jgi:hypothetical protein
MGCFQLKAQSSITSARILPIQNLPTESGPVFQAQYGEITYTASFPSMANNLDSLDLTLIILNKTGNNFVIRDFSEALYGFDFHLVDASEHDIDATDELKNVRRAIPSSDSEPYDLAGGWSTVILKPGTAIVITLPLKQFIPIKSLGKYTLHVYWRDSKPSGQITWAPSATPKVEFGGKILLQQTGSGISIAVAN